MNSQKLSFLLMLLINYLHASEYVNIPCSEYKLGTSWANFMKGEHIESHIKETVVSRKDNQIILKTVTKNKMYNIEQTTTTLTYLFEDNGTIYSAGEEIINGGYKLKNKNIPDVPICGKVSKIFQYRTVSDTQGSYSNTTPQMRQTVTIQKIANKRVKIKAGEFNAKIFQRNTKIEVLNKKNAAITKVASTQYYVNKIGLIKQNNTSAIIMPENSIIAMPKMQKNIVTIELVSYKY